MECLPNKLTPLYSKIYYEEENYLKVKTAVFKYITPPHSKGWVCWYVNILVRSTFLYSYILIFLNSYYILPIWLSYPLSYSSTDSISSVSCVLILSCLKSYLSICTILFIKSITPTFSSISLFLKNLVFKLLIRGVLCPILI